MNTSKHLSLFAGFLTAILMASPALAKKDQAEVNQAGMELVKKTRLTSIYVDPEVNLSMYRKIMLKDATVSFKKNWQREQNRNSGYAGAFWVKDSDVKRIKEETSALLKEVFTQELEDRGYTLVDMPGEDVLIVEPEIVEMDVVSPDLQAPVRGKSFSDTAGEMTLVLNLYDSQSNDLLVKARDRKIDYKTGYYEWRNRVNNRFTAKRAMTTWAETLATSLNEDKLVVVR